MTRIVENLVAATFSAAMLGASAISAGAGERAYIPLGSAGEVAIIDTGTDTVIGRIGGLAAVHGLAATPDGQVLIAGSFDERKPNGGAPARPSGVSEEEHAAHHGGGPAGAAKEEAAISTVSVVRVSDQSVLRRIDVPGAVHHVAVSPDGRFAVVTHPNAGGISAIDLTTYRVVARVATGPLTNYAAFSPDGGAVYVSNAGNNTVSAVDTDRWTIGWSATTSAAPEHIVLSRDGATLYVNNVEDGSVSIVDVGERKVVATVPVGDTLHGIDLSDDGRTLFVAALGDDKVVAIDLAAGAAARSATLAPAPYHLAALRGTDKLYVSSADAPKLWVVDRNSLAVTGEIAIGGKGHQMVLAPGS